MVSILCLLRSGSLKRRFNPLPTDTPSLHKGCIEYTSLKRYSKEQPTAGCMWVLDLSGHPSLTARLGEVFFPLPCLARAHKIHNLSLDF